GENRSCGSAKFLGSLFVEIQQANILRDLHRVNGPWGSVGRARGVPIGYRRSVREIDHVPKIILNNLAAGSIKPLMIPPCVGVPFHAPVGWGGVLNWDIRHPASEAIPLIEDLPDHGIDVDLATVGCLPECDLLANLVCLQ